MTANTALAKPMLTPNEVARSLGLSAQTVLNLIRDGSLVAVNVARTGSRRPRYAVTGDSLSAFLVSRRVTANTAGEIVVPRRSQLRGR